MAIGSIAIKNAKAAGKSTGYAKKKSMVKDNKLIINGKVLSLLNIEESEVVIGAKFLMPANPKTVKHAEPEDAKSEYASCLVPIDANAIWRFTLDYYEVEMSEFEDQDIDSDEVEISEFKDQDIDSDEVEISEFGDQDISSVEVEISEFGDQDIGSGDFSIACNHREFLRNQPAEKISICAQSMRDDVTAKIKAIQEEDPENFNRCFSNIINILLSRFDVDQLVDCRSCLNDPDMAALFTEKQITRLSLFAEKQAIKEAARQAEEAKAREFFKSELQAVTNSYNIYYDKLLELILVNINVLQAANKHTDPALLKAINTLTDLHSEIISNLVRYGRASYLHAKASARVLDAVLFGATERLLESRHRSDQVPILAHSLTSQMSIIFGAEQRSEFQEQARVLKAGLSI